MARERPGLSVGRAVGGGETFQHHEVLPSRQQRALGHLLGSHRQLPLRGGTDRRLRCGSGWRGIWGWGRRPPDRGLQGPNNAPARLSTHQDPRSLWRAWRARPSCTWRRMHAPLSALKPTPATLPTLDTPLWRHRVRLPAHPRPICLPVTLHAQRGPTPPLPPMPTMAPGEMNLLRKPALLRQPWPQRNPRLSQREASWDGAPRPQGSAGASSLHAARTTSCHRPTLSPPRTLLLLPRSSWPIPFLTHRLPQPQLHIGLLTPRLILSRCPSHVTPCTPPRKDRDATGQVTQQTAQSHAPAEVGSWPLLREQLLGQRPDGCPVSSHKLILQPCQPRPQGAAWPCVDPWWTQSGHRSPSLHLPV